MINYVCNVPTKENSIRISDNKYEFNGKIFDKVCPVCGRLYSSNKSVCYKHAYQKENGGITDNNPRQTKDLNDYILNDEDKTATIILFNKDHEPIGKALIDLEDYDKVKGYTWRIAKDGTVEASIYPQKIKLHRLITDAVDENIKISHINGNTLDNRKENLKVKHTQVTKNNSIGCTKSSSKKTVASIKFKQKRVHLGSYAKKEKSKYARWCAEKLLLPTTNTKECSFKLTDEEKNEIKVDVYNRLMAKLNPDDINKSNLFEDDSFDSLLLTKSDTENKLNLFDKRLTTESRGISMRDGKYRSKIAYQKQEYYLGTFINREDALFSRRYAEILLWDYPLAKEEIENIDLTEERKEEIMTDINNYFLSKGVKIK